MAVGDSVSAFELRSVRGRRVLSQDGEFLHIPQCSSLLSRMPILLLLTPSVLGRIFTFILLNICQFYTASETHLPNVSKIVSLLPRLMAKMCPSTERVNVRMNQRGKEFELSVLIVFLG